MRCPKIYDSGDVQRYIIVWGGRNAESSFLCVGKKLSTTYLYYLRRVKVIRMAQNIQPPNLVVLCNRKFKIYI